MDKEALSPNDFLDLIKRRLPIIGAVFLGIVLLSFIIAYSLNNLYAGQATVKIEDPDRELPWIEEEDDKELAIIRVSDLAMSADNLEPIIEKHQLFSEERGDRPARSVVRYLRKNTEVSVLRDEPEPGEKGLGTVIGFRIDTYQPDPKAARNAARDLLRLFLDTHEKRQTEKIDRVIDQLLIESKSLQEILIQKERELSLFISRNPDRLRKDREVNQARLERKVREREGLDADLRNLETRKTVLQTELARTDPIEVGGPGGENRLEELTDRYIRLIGLYEMDHPDVKQAYRELIAFQGGGSLAIRQALEEAIQRKRLDLMDLRGSYGPEHPEIKSLERAIVNLQRQLDELPNADSDQPEAATNPVYIDLQIQLRSTLVDIRAKVARKGTVDTEIIDLENLLRPAPEIEQELLTLEREANNARAQYQQVQGKLQDARTARELKDLGVRWEVKSSPTIPYAPAFPNRPLYIVLGIFLGLTLGIGSGLVAEALDGTIRGTRDVRHVMQMPPIAAIPVIKTASDLRRDRVRRVVMACATVAAIGLVTLYVRLQINDMV